MARVSDPPRRLLLSWRPGSTAGEMKTWAERFQQRLDVECSPITVINSQAPGADRAQLRNERDGWTDFVALVTFDYAAACAEELLFSLPLLSQENSSLRFWAVRMDPNDPREWSICADNEKKTRIQPWSKALRWHFMPDLLPQNRGNYVDPLAHNTNVQMALECVNPIKRHLVDCNVCHGKTSGTEVELPDSGILNRLRRLLGRKQ